MLAMHPLTAFSVLILSRLASAAGGNLTISFNINEDTSTCGSESQSKWISLTTDDAPSAFTCFSLSDTFSQTNTTGFQLGRGTEGLNDPSLSLGVNYTLGNLNSYIPAGNYTQVSVNQVNITSDQAAEGKPAGRRFNVYSLPDCQQVSQENGGDDPPEKHPWYLQSCQTASSGDCQVVEQGIQSFSIQEDTGSETCANWAFLGAAPMSSQPSIRYAGGLAAMVALWAIL